MYGNRPAWVTTEEFFKERGYVNVFFEFEFIKKFLIMSIFLIIILNVYFTFEPSLHLKEFFYIHPKVLTSNAKIGRPVDPQRKMPLTPEDIFAYTTPWALQMIIGWISFAGFLRIITQSTRREFRFYIAKACSKIISEKENEFDKMKYLLLLLDSYNKYLHRNIKMRINNIEEIYSIIYYKDSNERNQIIESICGCLESENNIYRILKLAKYLSSIYLIPGSKFYVKESFAQRLKWIAAILATTIPIIISTLTLVAKKIGLG
jgi:hypothetical protein